MRAAAILLPNAQGWSVRLEFYENTYHDAGFPLGEALIYEMRTPTVETPEGAATLGCRVLRESDELDGEQKRLLMDEVDALAPEAASGV